MSSLLDALLLEEPTPLTTPTLREIFIALRRDGARGSGTANDPYDGGTRLGPEFSALLTYDPLEVIVVSDSAPFDPLDPPVSITIANVTGESAAIYNNVSGGINQPFAGADLEIINPHAFKVRLTDPPVSPPGRAQPGLITPPYITATPSGGSAIVGMRLYWPVVRLSAGAVSHGLVDYQIVRFSSLDTTPASPLLQGDFPAILLGDDYVWCLLTAYPQVAASGAVACASVLHQFDEVMRAAPRQSLIHLGPGTFETRGYCQLYHFGFSKVSDLPVGFALKPGQKLRGSGINTTTLKLVGELEPVNAATIVTSNVDSDEKGDVAPCEASDFTLDCNLFGQPKLGGLGLAPVTCNAINLYGEFSRLRRIRAINWGCQNPAEPFVVHAGGAASFVADCVVDKPSENNTHESTIMSGDGTGNTLRHNYVNIEYANGFLNHPIAVTSLTRDSVDHKLAHLTTAEPHRHVKEKNLVVRGALIDSSENPYHHLPNNPYNGTFAIVEIISETELTYRMYANPEVNADVSAGATIGHGISTEYVALTQIGDVIVGLENVTFKTKRPHHRTKGQTTNMLGGVYYIDSAGHKQFPFQASHALFHRICEVGPANSLQPNQFTVKLPASFNPAWTLDMEVGGTIGLDFHGPASFASPGGVTEGNSVYDCAAAFYTDTAGGREMVVRGNYYSNIGAAVSFNYSGGLSGPFYAQIGAVRLRRDISNPKIAIFEYSTSHGLKEGDAVRILGAEVGGVISPVYNGTFSVLRRVSDTEFAYEMENAADNDADPPQPVPPDVPSSLTFQIHWQIQRFLYEGNICELRGYDGNSLRPPGGVGSGANYADEPPYAFPNAIFRGNFFRHVDNAVTNKAHFHSDAQAFRLGSFQSSMLEDNVTELIDPHDIHHFKSRDMHGFQNLAPDGTEVPVFNDISGSSSEFTRDDGLEDKLRDALLYSFL